MNSKELSLKSAFFIFFTILVIIFGFFYYRSFPKNFENEIDYNEIIEEKNDENEKNEKNELIKKFNFVKIFSQICILILIVINDAIITIPYVIFITILFFNRIFSSNLKDIKVFLLKIFFNNNFLKIWSIVSSLLKFYTFFLLFMQLLFRNEIVIKNSSQKYTQVFGLVFKHMWFSFFSLISMLAIFIINCIHIQIIEKLSAENVCEEDFHKKNNVLILLIKLIEFIENIKTF